MSKPIIAIDGPAASGKGTLARRLAKTLNYAYMDTGALYRATAFEVLNTGLSPKDKNDARDAAQMVIKKIERARDPAEILNNPALRNDDVGQAASQIAAYPEIRDTLKGLQQNFAKNPGSGAKGAILDGRDIGSIICPHADIKLFITADLELRAQRRLKELQSKGISATYSTVLSDMRARDQRDSGRNAAPMAPAADAITIDSSALDADAMFEKAHEIIRGHLQI